MRRLYPVVFLLVLLSGNAFAQDDLFGMEKKDPQKGFVISVHGIGELPLADMADRFGASYRLGANVFYKTKQNWLIGVKGDFLFSNKVSEPGLLDNISRSNSIINLNGQKSPVPVFLRGYTVGIQAGKIFNTILGGNNPDNGLLVMGTVGFIQHKILLSDKNNEFPQLTPEYKKGYDRLTNGVLIEPFVGYNHIGKDGFLNFNIGLNALVGFTGGRRTYNFDTQMPGNDKRLDVLVGIRGSWYIPIFRKKSDELFFE